MKKILSIVLVLVLCLTMLVACGKNDTKNDDTNKNEGGTTTTAGSGDEGTGTTTGSGDSSDDFSVEDAKTALVALYQKGSAKEPMELKATQKVFAVYQGLTIEWTIAVSEGDADAVKVEAIEGDEVNVNIVVPTAPSADIKFTAKATIKDANGNSAVAEFLYVVPGVKIPDPESTLTIKEAADLGISKAHNTYTDGKYYVTGTVVEVTSTQYGNMKIKDNEGNTLTIYGSYGADGKDSFNALDPQPKSGDKVKLYGIIGQYNDTPQMKNAWIKEINGKKPGKAATTTRPSSSVKEPAADSEVSIADAIEIGLSKEDNVYTANKYYVTGEITEIYNAEYGNMKIKDSKGNILTIYGTYGADGAVRFDKLKTQPKVGDTVTIYGKLGQFGGVAQIKNGWIVKINGTVQTAAPSNIGEPVDPAVGKAYKFGMIQENVSASAVYYLAGGMNGYYMTTTNDAASAIDVYLEETDGGYYLYAMIGGKKNYINMVVSSTHVNGVYESTAKTVYTYDKTSKTLTAMMQPEGYEEAIPYWFGTRNDKEYTTVGPCATKYSGFYCMFYEA